VKTRRWMLPVCCPSQSKDTCPPGRVPFSRFHSLMVPSQLPVASVCSSGLKASACTAAVCACQARSSIFPLSRHTRAPPRLLPIAQEVPWELVATDQGGSKDSVKTVSCSMAPEIVVSCCFNPDRYKHRCESIVVHER